MIIPRVFLLAILTTTATAAPISKKDDACAWQVLFPYLPCIGDQTLQHGSNHTTSPSQCYQSSRTGDCSYCGGWNGANALLNAKTRKIDTLCGGGGGYCDFDMNGDLACYKS